MIPSPYPLGYPWIRVPLDRYPHFRGLHDLDQVRVEVGRIYCDHEMALTGQRAVLNAWMNALPVGAVAFTSVGYGAEAIVRPGSLGTFYVVMYLCTGSGTFHYGGQHAEIDAGNAVVVSPTAPLTMELSDDSVLAILRIDEWVMREYLGGELGHAPDKAPEFDLEMKPGDDRVRLWQHYFLHEFAELNVEDSTLLSSPFLTQDAIDLLAGRLLHVQPHNYTDRMRRMRHPLVSSRVVRTVMDYVQAHPAEPHTATSLAKHANCSRESLFKSFRSDAGLAPMEYVRRVRLRGSNRDLRLGSRTSTSVMEVAHRWGFGHLSHFAEHHRRAYGASPSETLDRGA